MPRRYILIALALAAVAGGNGFLWLTRPSAQPVAPQTVFPKPEPAADSSTPEPETTTKAESRPDRGSADASASASEPSEPDKPLNLTLESNPAPPDDTDSEDAKVTRPLDKPRQLDLTLDEEASVRPWISKDLNLFNTERGTRAFTRGHWISDKLRLRGGIGYSENEETQERDIAIGVGVDLAF